MKNKAKELLLELFLTAIISGIIAYIVVSSIGIGDRLEITISAMNAKVLKLERVTANL